MSTEQQAATETVHTRRALVVDDEPKVRAVICQMLERLGCDVTEAGDGEEALERVAAEFFDVALIDVRLPRGREGLEVTRRAKRVRPDLHVIVITGIPTGDIAFQAGKEGADDFLPKPLDMDQLRVILDQLPIPPGGRDGERSLPWFIGDSPAIRSLYRRIRERVAPSDETVLILGESGTGKELVAQAIHFWGPTRRRRHAFVAVNCSSVAESVLMNELFGHEREAFTGAAGRRKGLIEQAHQGTLFLDEIGDASENLQMALLRVLEQGEVRRLGSSETIEVDVRIIAATNKHLEREVSEGKFRKDLYYRLNVVPIDMPPLRDRPGDIPLLLDHFLRRYGEPDRRFAECAVRALQRCRWHGNVRELENLVRRLIVQVEAPEILCEYLPAQYRETPVQRPIHAGSFREAKEVWERHYMEALLQRVGGNVSEAARLAGLGRTYFHEKLRKFQIDPSAYRDQAPPIA